MNKNFIIGDKVILLPTSPHSGISDTNPSLKECSVEGGVIIRLNNHNHNGYKYHVKWLHNDCENNYREEDLDYHESNKKLIDEIKINDLGDPLIGLKDYKFISISHLLIDFLKSKRHTSTLNTYYVNKDNTVSSYLQCDAGRYRSLNDIYSLCKYYKEDVTIEEILKTILLSLNDVYKVEQGEMNILLSYCSDIQNIRVVTNYNVKIDTFYHHFMTRRKGCSHWSWIELFEKINIYNLEDLKNFYKENLKIETS